MEFRDQRQPIGTPLTPLALSGQVDEGAVSKILCKQRFPVREAPLDGSGSAGLFLLPKDTAARELKAGRLDGILPAQDGPDT